jgi:hypothetical protein
MPEHCKDSEKTSDEGHNHSTQSAMLPDSHVLAWNTVPSVSIDHRLPLTEKSSNLE